MIDSTVWGPHMWQALHYITLGYPTNPSADDKLRYKAFFTLLKYILPCSICAKHYSENLIKYPLSDDVLNNRESFIKWLIDFHNIVNISKHKPVMEYSEALKQISKGNNCTLSIVALKNNDVEQSTISTSTNPPTIMPTNMPTNPPTLMPTNPPTLMPTNMPTNIPTNMPTNGPKSNISTVYYLIGILFVLIIIAVLYKRK